MQRGEALPAAVPRIQCSCSRASAAESIAEEAESVATRGLTKSVKQVEKEVALVAKAIISGQQEMALRLGEERSVRRAAEAVLDARIKTLEHQVKRCGSKGPSGTGDGGPVQTPVLTPASSLASLPVMGGRLAT